MHVFVTAVVWCTVPVIIFSLVVRAMIATFAPWASRSRRR